LAETNDKINVNNFATADNHWIN